MNTVTIEVSSLDKTKQRLLSAFESEAQGAFITFPTLEALWKALTPKRWDIIKDMTGAGPLAIREVSRRIERDVRAVHSDIQVLLSCGVLEKTTEGKIEFPYDAVHVDFMVTKAA
ncbi:MAG TPA: transcriptional regulator [Gammaproteobacteria bacterium]|nr:transcriptional regulator [Gammaproteobacteria bacterium]